MVDGAIFPVSVSRHLTAAGRLGAEGRRVDSWVRLEHACGCCKRSREPVMREVGGVVGSRCSVAFASQMVYNGAHH